ncbi:sortase domain-bontaining protein [Nocardioides sp. R1-1]|uniref:sortase domain-containing protein n=1 Tax=Nocardioides sp. R1-1 TaxID=3383502 RepID=UPI0038D1ADF4
MGTTTRARRRTAVLLTTLGVVLGLALSVFGMALAVDRTPATPPGSAATAAARPEVVVPSPAGADPTAAPAAAAPVAAPTRLEIPAIGVDERLEGRGLRPDGSFDTPDFGDASWYRLGPRPGEPGGAVVVAHVHGPDGPDVFWELAELDPGDEVRVRRPGAVAVFVVDAVERVPKEDLPEERIWPESTVPLLRLITCGGPRTARGYPDNTVVYAHLAATLAG